jgi:hypothetical protein
MSWRTHAWDQSINFFNNRLGPGGVCLILTIRLIKKTFVLTILYIIYEKNYFHKHVFFKN